MVPSLSFSPNFVDLIGNPYPNPPPIMQAFITFFTQLRLQLEVERKFQHKRNGRETFQKLFVSHNSHVEGNNLMVDKLQKILAVSQKNSDTQH